MNFNYKIFLKCILSGANYSFISNYLHERKNHSVIIGSSKLYFLTLHVRFSSVFYSCQLIDIFAYEIPYSALDCSLSKKSSSVIGYNFHSFRNQDRFTVFTYSLLKPVYSITELFSSANWLERELHEMQGLVVLGKKDIRNLMLQYGDSSSPLKKSFPSIGFKETFYDPLKDVVIQNPVSLQI